MTEMRTVKGSAECIQRARALTSVSPAVCYSSAITGWMALEQSSNLSVFWAACMKINIIIPTLQGSCSQSQ